MTLRPFISIICSIIAIASISLVSADLYSAENDNGQSIFKYKKVLSITDLQEQNLRDILTKFNNYIAAKTQVLNRLRDSLNKMLMEKADIGLIRAKLRQIARAQADASCEDIITARAIEGELTQEQMAKWREIQDNFRNASRQAPLT